MSPTTWGPPVWRFFHTLAEKMNEDKFQELGPQLFNLIRKICRVLPCPDCSMPKKQTFKCAVYKNGELIGSTNK